MEKYYIGLDIGTNSVGWAVTDEKYRILKRKGKSMWGIRLFDDAKTASDRRIKRAARRRLQRRKERILLLQELFSDEMSGVDDTFFIRLNESRLHIEDKQLKVKHPLFIDKDYSDKEYYKEYPTIFHLRKELIENTAPHDIRLVYLSLHHILKNRGHFLIEGDLSEAKNFGKTFEQLIETICDEFSVEIYVESNQQFEKILRDKSISKREKANQLSRLLTIEESTYDKKEIKKIRGSIDNICKLMVGNKGDVSKIFDVEEQNLKKTSFSFSDAAYDEEIREDLEKNIPEKCFIIDSIKAIYDWNTLVDVLDGEEYFAFAKVKKYEEHKSNLRALKDLMKKYCATDVYKRFFDGKEAEGKSVKNSGKNKKAQFPSYAGYIGSSNTNGSSIDIPKCTEEELYKELEKILKDIEVEEKDKSKYNDIMSKIMSKNLLPLQRSKDNATVPHQLHEAELKKILENASNYLGFLNDKDNSGLTVAEKILKLFSFRIPYYVGPLSERHKETGANVWVVRKEEGKIYPWNFEEKVDLEKSNEAFIQRMTNKCTYLIGEDVLPKNSLLYSRFMVLNELNNLKIRGNKISVKCKQDIYKEIFEKHVKVTGKMLLRYLKDYDETLSVTDLSGFDGDFKSNLSSYLDFNKKIFIGRMGEDYIKEASENIIRWKTIYGDDDKMLLKAVHNKFGNELSEKQQKEVCRLRYSGWGRFSERFLNGVEGSDRQTGETFTIIEALWQTNNNLMQLLSNDKFTFKEEIDKINSELTNDLTEISYDSTVKDLYVSPAVKRAIWQSIEITEEIKKVMKSDPDKIFVEMARGDEKKERKKSRKTHLLELYQSCKTDRREWIKEIEERNERDFNSIKLYLYYTQMGRCMYTGEEIDIHQLMSNNSKWDRDHIYPQSVVKDDSLDNLVLVNKTYNAKKSNGVLSADIRNKQKDRWLILLQKGFISKKKYDRLMKKDGFSDEERAGFINRQLVEVRQSSKAVFELLSRIYKDTYIVSVKAGLVSQFRNNDLNVLKSRRINDYHHAKDAYLNIVVGNVYDSKFTSNPRKWLKENADKQYNVSRVFDEDVYRGKELVWEAPCGKGKKRSDKGEKYGGTIDFVRKTLNKNDILYTEYTYCEKGELFNATIEKKSGKSNIQLKTGLETAKYGGYKNANTAYFAIVEFERKGNREKLLLEVPIYVANMLPHNPDAYIEYCQNIKKLENVKILRACIKKNSLITVDGFPMRIRGTDEKNILFKNAMQLVLNNHEECIRHVEKYLEKNSGFEVNEKLDGFDDSMLLSLYDALTEKLGTVYAGRPANKSRDLRSKREQFVELSLKNKAKVVNEILNMLRCDAATKADISAIGEVKNAGSISVNKNTLGKSKLILINQSVTGLFENRIEL